MGSVQFAPGFTSSARRMDDCRPTAHMENRATGQAVLRWGVVTP